MMQYEEQNVKSSLPILYNPKMLSLFSTLSNIWAWLNLAGGVIYLLYQIFTFNSQVEQIIQARLFYQHSIESGLDVEISQVFRIFLQTLSLIGNFFLFRCISIGLNVLLEIGFTMMPESDEEGTNNE